MSKMNIVNKWSKATTRVAHKNTLGHMRKPYIASGCTCLELYWHTFMSVVFSIYFSFFFTLQIKYILYPFAFERCYVLIITNSMITTNSKNLFFIFGFFFCRSNKLVKTQECKVVNVNSVSMVVTGIEKFFYCLVFPLLFAKTWKQNKIKPKHANHRENFPSDNQRENVYYCKWINR